MREDKTVVDDVATVTCVRTERFYYHDEMQKESNEVAVECEYWTFSNGAASDRYAIVE